MKNTEKLKYGIGLVAAGLILYIAPMEVWARAGGGSAKGGVLLGLIIVPIILAYSGIIAYLVAKDNKESKALLSKISIQDPEWEIGHLQTRIDEVFFKVQQAWRDRDQELAKDYMSQRLYGKHKLRTDDMLKRGIKNEMENLQLQSAKIVEVVDYKNNAKDFFWVVIEGLMMDYTIIESTGAIVDGAKKNRSFKELWRFKREDHGWVVDEIDQNMSIATLRCFAPYSEEISN